MSDRIPVEIRKRTAKDCPDGYTSIDLDGEKYCATQEEADEYFSEQNEPEE